ncbi:MAG: helix-turn-helix domain-containing protein [Actinomycetota bacterium]|nr:helix-turn-helix domain-containing protein [Actinomycetota bacterium]
MDEQLAVARNVALQREWYGESLGDRVRRLVVAFDCSQAQLAEVLGVSAPMLSQLMSGRRAKMVMLERRVLTPEVASGDPAAIRAALEQVRDSRPTVSRPTGGRSASSLEILPVEEHGDWNNPDVLVEALRAVVAPAELAAAAGLLREQCPQLARVLRHAAGNEAGRPSTGRSGRSRNGTERR